MARGRDAPPDLERTLARAALRLLEKEEWTRLTVAAIARAAKIPLADVLSFAGSKIAVAGFVLRLLGQETSERYSADSTSGETRERLFDVTMTFFDVHQAHSRSLKTFYRALQHDPTTLLALRGDILHLSAELLALAEADFGLSSRLQAGVFAAVLFHAVSAWRDDDSEMGKTMAQLDRDLRRLERLLWPKPAEKGTETVSSPTRKSSRHRSPSKGKKRSR